MAKIKAKHNVDRNVARFGSADPPELCEYVANSIPTEDLQKAERILDVAQGCCGISKAVVNRLTRDLYEDHFNAIFRVHGVDNDLALVNRSKRLGFQSVCADFLEWDPDVEFDVIVGNPPYQRAREVRNVGSPLWPEFIQKSVDLVKPGGLVSLVVPFTWMQKNARSKAWKVIRQNDLISLKPFVDWAFPGVDTGGITVITLRKQPYSGSTLLPDGTTVDITKPTPSNNQEWTAEVFDFLRSHKKLELKVKTGPINPSINSNHWSPVQTETHCYEIFYSSAKKRRSIWCDEPIGDWGQLKLAVPTYGDMYGTAKITEVGCGRQVEYVLGSREELEEIKAKFESPESQRMNRLNAYGAYHTPLKNVVR
jgi:hypothetical protein